MHETLSHLNSTLTSKSGRGCNHGHSRPFVGHGSGVCPEGSELGWVTVLRPLAPSGLCPISHVGPERLAWCRSARGWGGEVWGPLPCSLSRTLPPRRRGRGGSAWLLPAPRGFRSLPAAEGQSGRPGLRRSHGWRCWRRWLRRCGARGACWCCCWCLWLCCLYSSPCRPRYGGPGPRSSPLSLPPTRSTGPSSPFLASPRPPTFSTSSGVVDFEL